MFGLKSSLLALGLAAGLATSLPMLSKRETTLVSGDSVNTDSWGLWAYGGDISGSSVCFADDLAYIGDCSLLNGTVWSAVTFYQSTYKGEMSISPNSSEEAFSSTPYLYLITDSSAPMGFTSSDSAAPSGATTTGWVWYGSQLMWSTSAGSYETFFYAEETSIEDVYQLLWIDDDTSVDGLTLVQIKATEPSTHADTTGTTDSDTSSESS